MKFIVTTTINPPTEALLKFSNMQEWTLIVVGDVITPHDEYSKINCIYLSPENQDELYPKLSKLIGWRNIQRRNIGILHAYKLGAEIVALVDDDNIPDDTWGKNLLVGKNINCTVYCHKNLNVFDPLSVTNYSHMWHRGFPIVHLSTKNETISHTDSIVPDVQADFWNGDPDIDAICRMQYPNPCAFKDDVFPFSSMNFSPFNSQNTFLTRKVIPYYFCFPFIGRMDDIWAAYFCEAQGFKVVYNKASVEQKRNEHDIVKDFNNEILGYQYTHKLLENPLNIKNFIPEESWNAFVEYQRELGI